MDDEQIYQRYGEPFIAWAHEAGNGRGVQLNAHDFRGHAPKGTAPTKAEIRALVRWLRREGLAEMPLLVRQRADPAEPATLPDGSPNPDRWTAEEFYLSGAGLKLGARLNAPGPIALTTEALKGRKKEQR